MATLLETGNKLQGIAMSIYKGMSGISDWEEAWGAWEILPSGESVNYSFKYKIGEDVKSLNIEQQLGIVNYGANPAGTLLQLWNSVPKEKQFKKVKIVVKSDTSFKTEFEY
jgi:hypothetical protein